MGVVLVLGVVYLFYVDCGVGLIFYFVGYVLDVVQVWRLIVFFEVQVKVVMWVWWVEYCEWYYVCMESE